MKKKDKKKTKKEYLSEKNEFNKIDLEEKDNIETIDEVIKKEKKKKEIRQHRKMVFLGILIIIGVCLLLCARYISTTGLVIREYAIKSSNLSKDYNGMKIVQFSDLHYGSTVFESELKNIIKQINKQNPNIVVFTGDLIEQNVTLTNTEIENIITELNKIEATSGLYAIKGNHDYENDYFEAILGKTKFKILDNESDLIYINSTTPIRIIGFDDLLKGEPSYDDAFTIEQNNTEEKVTVPYTIVLIHEPDQIDEFKTTYSDFDVVFAGHSHAGQVRLPFIGAIITPEGAKKYYDDYYKVDDKELFVSNGIGTNTLPLRFMNKPSITLYRFYAQ